MIARVFLAIALASACGAAVTNGQALPATPTAEITSPAGRQEGETTAPSPGKPRFATRNPRYQVRPGDVIEILFSPTTEFNQAASIQPDGYVMLREVGDLYVQDMTLPELTQAIRSAYEKILREPAITVLLKDFEKPHFVVNGQVGRPGKYELRASTTISEAVGIAGGFTERAKHSQVLLFRRASDDWVEVKKVDLKAISKGKLREDVRLRPGDMLFVPQNAISKIKPFLPISSIGTYFGVSPF